MAATLRHPLTTGTCLLALGSIGFPLLPAFFWCMRAAASGPAWQLLFAERQFPQSLLATVISTAVAISGALLLLLVTLAACWPGPRWQSLIGRLPWMLAIPHLALASAMLVLFSDGGWLSRFLPGYLTPGDPWGIGMGLILAVKEAAFLLWVSAGLLNHSDIHPQVITARTLGYGPWQAMIIAVVPRLLPALAPALLASAAWCLSVVDVALLIGPGNPPTLAVLSWQWINDSEPVRQQAGLLIAILLLLLLGILSIAAGLLWRASVQCFSRPGGKRRRDLSRQTAPLAGGLLSAVTWLTPGILAATSLTLPFGSLTAISFSAWQWIDPLPLYNTLFLGLSCGAIGALICLLWLYSGLSRYSRLLWLPLLLPTLPLVTGQYHTLLFLRLDGQLTGVIWSHLLWVIPWMLLVLQPAWEARDPRLTITARTLGWGPVRCFWSVDFPLMARPLLTGFAIGFSVSCAQYLSTLYNGGGRVTTLATEAVALSSGGDLQRQSSQALLLALLPLIIFLFSAGVRRWLARHRQGLS